MTTDRVDNGEKINQGRGGYGQSVPTSVPTDTETLQISRPEYLRDELLPGILNDIVVQVIAPKLSGVDINVLSLVSPSWKEAIHRRWVYDARVRSDSLEPFVVVLHDHFEPDSKGPYKIIELRLYSLKDNSAYNLPPIPSPERIRYGCKCIALDGKIYILGGRALRWTRNSPHNHGRPQEHWCGRKKMFMLDLAGHNQWKQCASMQEGRYQFGAGVLDGKIYVFGGRNGHAFVHKSEVYDPRADAWSLIEDMVPGREGHQVAALGEELFVYGGVVPIVPGNNMFRPVSAKTVVAYHPVKDEWRELDLRINPNIYGFPCVTPDLFVAQGKFHKFTTNGIEVYDIDTNSWSVLHPDPGFPRRISDFSLDEIVVGDYKEFYIFALGNEILMLHFLSNEPFGFGGVYRLCQSRGFGKNRGIALEEIRNCRLGSELWHDLYNSRYFVYLDMCLIQL